MVSVTTEEVESLKEKGNNCVREGKYEEAIIHYTYATKLDPKNFSLYSNRSFAFLKIKQYYHALEDALQTIRLKPDWPKGHFRKAEVEFSTFQYADALLSYRLALKLKPNDSTIEEAIKKTSLVLQKNQKADDQFPWLGAGVGIICGVIIVMGDQLTAKPALSHPLLMALLTISVASLGFGLAKAYRYYLFCQRKGLLDAPVDLLQESQNSSDNFSRSKENGDKLSNASYQRYSKAQARQKLKKGKA